MCRYYCYIATRGNKNKNMFRPDTKDTTRDRNWSSSFYYFECCFEVWHLFDNNMERFMRFTKLDKFKLN